jgi:hypothetical protein
MYLMDWGSGAGASDGVAAVVAAGVVVAEVADSVVVPLEHADIVPSATMAPTPMIRERRWFLMR